MNNDILTSAEAAEYLKIATTTVRTLALTGKIPGVQIGDDWRFMRGQLYEYLAKQAENGQAKRQTEAKTLKIAKENGDLPPSKGRRCKVNTAEIIRKYEEWTPTKNGLN